MSWMALRLVRRIHSWTKQEYISHAVKCNSLTEVQSVVLPKPVNSDGEPLKCGEVTLYSVPAATMQVDEIDPLTQAVRITKPKVLFLQVDPLLYLSRHRWLVYNIRKLKDKTLGEFVMDDFVPRNLDECTVTLQTLDIIAQGKNFTHEKSFTLFTDHVLTPKAMETMTQDLMKAIKEHVFDGLCRWPFLAVSVYPAVMSKTDVVLGDIPEVLLRSILANTLNIREMREMFVHVISVMKHHYEHNKKVFLSVEHTLQMLYGNLLSPIRDQYVTALLRLTAEKHSSVSAWLGVHHVLPVQELWKEAINFSQAVKVPARKEGETDSELIEKHAILDVLNSTQAWNHPFLLNPFPYLFTDPSADELLTAKKTFHEMLTKYEQIMNKTVLLPEELVKELEAEMKTNSS